jgi:hypothetical protein
LDPCRFVEKGAGNGSDVGTMVERTTRLVLLVLMEGMDARSDREGFTRKLLHIPTRQTNTEIVIECWYRAAFSPAVSKSLAGNPRAPIDFPEDLTYPRSGPKTNNYGSWID